MFARFLGVSLYLLILAGLASSPRAAEVEANVLTSRPRAVRKMEQPLPVGEEVRTASRQQRRVVLGDGSVLYVAAETSVKRGGDRRLTLLSGVIFVDVPAGRGEEEFVIKTPHRELRTRGGRFHVADGKDGTDIRVTSGKVRVVGRADVLHAGQQLDGKADRTTAAARSSLLADWTRELMTEAETPLVPKSQYAGGRLIVRDPDGQEAQLKLRKYHIDTYVEDGFARTTIDQTYFNDTNIRLEGTFYFPLPADASLSRLAMYVDGQLMEGGMAERDYARQVYERIVYQQRDPALLEWLDGSTFKMRVFPLEPRQEKRLILSYAQKLPSLYGQLSYRFPTGHSFDAVRDWSFHARVQNGGKMAWSCSSHTLRASEEGSDLLLDARATNAKLERDVVLTLGGDAVKAPFSTAEHEGAKYLLVRYRPDLPSQPERRRRDWVFLFQASGDRDPLITRTQIEIVRGLLAGAESDDSFTVLTANTRVRAWKPQAQPVTPANVQAALSFLERAHLIGALDLGHALSKAQTHLQAVKHPYLVHVGSGIAAMGERRNDVLAKRIPEGTPYVGIGVGKRWNRALMKQAAERGDGYFTQINPDEPLSWRTFELSATLNAPRLLDVSVTDKAGQAAFLPFARSLAQGEEIAAIARIDKDMPQTVVIRGKLNGQPFEKELLVENVAEKKDYLPRRWARLEIERLLAEDALKHKPRIIALSKAMYVMTPFTSLLVLENEEMYQQFKVDRGRKDHWAMYPCPEKIPIVYEPEDGQPGDPKKGIKPSPRQVFKTIVRRERPNVLRIPEAPRQEVGVRGFVAMDDETFDVSRGNRPRLSAIPYMSRLVRRESNQHMREYENNKASKEEFFLDAKSMTAWNGYHGQSATVQALLMFDPEKRGLDVLTKAKRAPSAAGWFDTTPSRNWNLAFDPVNGKRIEFMSHLSDPTPDIQDQVQDLAEAKPSLSPLYQRPSYSGDDRLFFDLVSYAPGLNTSIADIRAVIEAEAAPQKKSKSGSISDIARRFLDKAYATGWQSYTVTAKEDQPAFRVVFDGQGRYVWERALPIGLRERVVCDGSTLWHIYPELGLAARRTVSRFHRAEAERVLPWVLPSQENLTHDADVIADGERTFAVVPHSRFRLVDGKTRPYIKTRFILDADYRLAERQFLQMPSGKLLYRETYSANGVIERFDGDGKLLASIKGALRTAAEPELRPDTSKLVVLSLPYRTREHVLKTRKIEKTDYAQLRFEDGLALLAADFAAGNSEVVNVFQRCFAGRDQHQLGLYVLLAACGQNLDSEHLDVLAQHPHDPLAQYLALHSSPVLRKHASQWAVGSNPWDEGYLQRLALAHALLQRWQNGRALGGSAAQQQAERERALAYVRANKGSAFAWSLLGLMQDRAREEDASGRRQPADNAALHRTLVEGYRLFADVPRFASSARYEEARSLFKSGQTAAARKRFRELYEQTRKEDRLPRLDGDFRAALLEGGAWTELMGRTAADLIQHKQWAAVLTLAGQCWQVDDQPLANHLLGLALADLPDDKDRLPLRLAGLSFLWETGQFARADDMLRTLLADPKASPKAALWRAAAKLAERRKMPAREMECLEQALALEYEHLPDVINLRQVREDYEKLLSHYQKQAEALVSLKVNEPAGFRAKVIRTADRWRALDRAANEACRLAADILQTLGERELTWDYRTTPVAQQPNEAGPWLYLAQELNQRGELTLADRAYQAAFEAEPTNAQILWDRAGNLRQAGQSARARELYRQLAESEWQPRFASLRTQARWELEKR